MIIFGFDCKKSNKSENLKYEVINYYDNQKKNELPKYLREREKGKNLYRRRSNVTIHVLCILSITIFLYAVDTASDVLRAWSRLVHLRLYIDVDLPLKPKIIQYQIAGG